MKLISSRCGGVELRGLGATAITKRKARAEPVLEKYNFIPNHTSLSLQESVRVNIQLILENVTSMKVNVFEIFDEATSENVSLLSPIVSNVLADLPLVQPDVTVLSKNSLELDNVKVEVKPLPCNGSALLVIGTNLLQQPEVTVFY